MTREQAVEFKGIYETRIRRFKETMNEENKIFNRAMIDMNQRSLAIVNRILSQMDRKVLSICPNCDRTGNHPVLRSTEMEDVLKCAYCKHIFTIRYGRVAA